jgi:hypothetical protein
MIQRLFNIAGFWSSIYVQLWSSFVPLCDMSTPRLKACVPTMLTKTWGDGGGDYKNLIIEYMQIKFEEMALLGKLLQTFDV